MCSGRTRIGVLVFACVAMLVFCLPAADGAGKSPNAKLGVVSTPIPIKLAEYGSGYLYGRPNCYFFITYGCQFYPLDKSDLKLVIAYLYPKSVSHSYRRPSASVSSPASPASSGGSTATQTPPQTAQMSGSAGACLSGYASLSTSGNYASLYAGGYASSGYGPYEPVPDPYGGYLTGGADAINSQGNFLVNQQQASLTAEMGIQARIETRRRQFDEWLYDRSHRPTLEDVREGDRQRQLQRSQNDALLTEIWSAKSLNVLLADLQKMQGNGVAVPQLDLDEGLLEQVNVTTGTGNGHAGLLRDGGRFTWPAALRNGDLKDDRQHLEDLTTDAVRRVARAALAPELLKDLTRTVDRLHKHLARIADRLPPNQYIEAKRFLNDLNNAVTVLHQPDARHYFDGKYAAQGKTVAELIKHMTDKGLQFAPAVVGTEEAYLALHRLLSASDESAQSQLAANR